MNHKEKQHAHHLDQFINDLIRTEQGIAAVFKEPVILDRFGIPIKQCDVVVVTHGGHGDFYELKHSSHYFERARQQVMTTSDTLYEALKGGLKTRTEQMIDYSHRPYKKIDLTK